MSGEDWNDTDDPAGGADGRTGTKTLTRTKKPSLYRVLLLNDDYTPMEFVVFILERFFNRRVNRRPGSCFTCTRRASVSAGSIHMRLPRPR
jgi:hypothetical protein